MLKKLYPESYLLVSDLSSFRRQESVFVALNLILLALLLLLHTVFASYWGHPPRALVAALGFGFLLKTLELFWLRGLVRPLTPRALAWLTTASVALNLALATLLATLTDHDDTPYSVLMVVPILETAFRFRLPAVLGVVAMANFLNFFGLWRYYQRHPPAELGEYLEAAITSLIFTIVGLVVWMLVNHLRQKENHLAHNLLELERTREKLMQEERLAAVGRLSSAIAHEIRNPVSMISSSIATAQQLRGPEREEMFGVAAEEAARLVTLATDFLAYARPRPPVRVLNSVADTVAYVADACRAHASQKGVQLEVEASGDLMAESDPGQVQQALVNLVMNAVQASPRGSTVLLHSYLCDDCARIDVENNGDLVSDEDRSRIFEPFFTTKPQGSGLGLAIARNIARSHGGDLFLAANGPHRVCFSLTLPMPSPALSGTRNPDGKNSTR